MSASSLKGWAKSAITAITLVCSIGVLADILLVPTCRIPNRQMAIKKVGNQYCVASPTKLGHTMVRGQGGDQLCAQRIEQAQVLLERQEATETAVYNACPKLPWERWDFAKRRIQSWWPQ